MRFLLRHPLIRTLTQLRGNPRVCVFTEPLWGLSMNLCLPYASVYMLALGLNDVEVGIVASVYMFMQMIFSFLSGPLTDKFGRRSATALFDVVAWSIPCVIWIFAVDFRFFVVAALFNGAMKVPTNSWNCLLIEDAEKSQIVHIYTWITICGHMSALFAPISSILISRLTLIPAMRILYINAFVVMTAKTILLYLISKETQVGLVRMRESKGQSLASQLVGYGAVLRKMRASRGMVFAILISALYGIVSMINTTFWQIIANKKLGVPDSSLPLFAMLRSLIALFFFFTVIAHINQLRLKNPLLMGFASYFVGQSILILTPAGADVFLRYAVLGLSLLFDGFGIGMLAMLAESLIQIHADSAERARVLAIFQMIVMLISAPFGWIGGLLSELSRNLPFVMNLALICVGIATTLIYYRARPHYIPQTAPNDADAPDAMDALDTLDTPDTPDTPASPASPASPAVQKDNNP
jgi:MFS family permease